MFSTVQKKMATIQTLQFPADNQDAILAEVYKCMHVFRKMDKSYEFALSNATNLPLLVNAPVEIPRGSPFVCFYGNPMARDLAIANCMFNEIQSTHQKEFSGMQLSAIETVAHFFRHSAILEADVGEKECFFARAMTLYKTVVLSFRQKTITGAVASSKTQLCMSYPPPDNFVAVEDRRRISHCFAGMALCALMGERSPMLFFSYSSAALAWEPFRRIELANVLRIQMLLVGKFDMKLASLHGVRSKPAGQSWEFSPDSMQKIDELMGFTSSTMINLPAVYDRMCKSLMLPMLLIHGTDDMVDQERVIIRPEDWDAAMDGAKKIVVRYGATACANCGVRESGRKFLRCSACHVAHYCGLECQRAHWKAHKPACQKASGKK